MRSIAYSSFLFIIKPTIFRGVRIYYYRKETRKSRVSHRGRVGRITLRVGATKALRVLSGSVTDIYNSKPIYVDNVLLIIKKLY